MTRLLFLILISVLTLQGCSEPKRPMIGVYFEGFSHISAPIRNFVVQGNNIGSKIAPYGSGDVQNCCIPLPVQWYPGLTVVVDWEKDSHVHTKAYESLPELYDKKGKRIDAHEGHYSHHRAVVTLAKYDDLDDLSSFQVHFLPCNQVAILPGAVYPDRQSYPDHFPQKMEEPNACPKP